MRGRAPRAAAWLSRLRAFGADRRGSVTVQTVIFSILLFGTAGLVLDSGRVYATHSEMQAFADQMALVAANELDGRDDAIQRAANAVYGFEGALPFMGRAGLAEDDLAVLSIEFYATMAPSDRPQNDMGEAFPRTARLAVATGPAPAYDGGDPALASRAAAYAVVRTAGTHVLGPLVELALSFAEAGRDGDPAGPEDLREIVVGAVAAAGIERRTCAAISTLVLCNPWEGVEDSPLDVAKGDPDYSIPGRSLAYFAPDYSRLDLPVRPVANGRLHGSLYPWGVRNQIFRLAAPVADAAGLCSRPYLMALAGESLDDNPSDYIRARARCLMARGRDERVCWAPGAPLSIAPADGDTVRRALGTIFDRWLPPFDRAVHENVAVGASGLKRARFFEPDRLATTPLRAGRPDGGAQPGMGYDICHYGTERKYSGGSPAGACARDFVGDYHEGGTAGAAETLMNLRMYLENTYHVSGLTLPEGIASWYDLYRYERQRFATMKPRETDGEAAELRADAGASSAPAPDAAEALRHGPTEYLRLSGADGLMNPGFERRRLRSAFVNCRAATAAGADASGRYDVAAEDVRAMDVYLPGPPAALCGEGRGACPPGRAIETRLYVELIDEATDAFRQRYTVHLVR